MAAAAAFLAAPSLMFWAIALGAQPAPVTRPAPPLRPQAVGRSHEITIYRDRNFTGPAVSISSDESNLRLAWTVNSVRVRGGTWQLCERANFHGSCFPLSGNSNNLGHRRIQSAREGPRAGIGWRAIGRSDISLVGWVHRRIEILGHSSMSQLRLCAEGAGIRMREAHARFTGNFRQSLDVPSQLDTGSCTGAQFLIAGRRSLLSVEVTAASVGIARARIRIEGR